MHNAKIVNMKLTRAEVCDLLIACTAIAEEGCGKKWNALHDKLEAILGEFDAKHPIEID